MIHVAYQEWRRLFFAHWPVPTERLRAIVPHTLEIDQYDGSAWISLVAFMVQTAQPPWVSFEETNVRTYVRLAGHTPGVYFFSLDAASVLAVIGARAALGLPYFWAAAREHVRENAVDYTLQRYGRTRPGCHLRYEVGEPRGVAALGTLDHFLVERYVLHVQRGPTVWSTRVRHQPYFLHSLELRYLRETLVCASTGIAFGGAPELIHFSAGVDVHILAPDVRVTS
jgi:uncharacterized protein YqjF (DUF2071 family)